MGASKRAIILAAGVGKRMAPLSYELPKALLTVRGEVLVERLIRQLRDAERLDRLARPDRHFKADGHERALAELEQQPVHQRHERLIHPAVQIQEARAFSGGGTSRSFSQRILPDRFCRYETACNQG